MAPSRDGLAVLQITDTHLFPDPHGKLLGVETLETFERVLDAALAEGRPDAILATGDIAQIGESAAYARFHERVRCAFDGPLLCVPGNHDLSAGFYDGLETARLELGGWTLLGVDTHVDDQVPGHLSERSLTALQAALEGAAGHVLVAGHHPPFEVGAAWLDTQRIDNGSRLVELLAGFDAVKAYVFGHVHQAFERRIGGVRYVGSPSTCFQFAPGSTEFAIDDLPPGWRMLSLHPDGTFETHSRRLDGFELNVDLTDRNY